MQRYRYTPFSRAVKLLLLHPGIYAENAQKHLEFSDV